MNYFVNNVTVEFVHHLFPPVNTNSTKKVDVWEKIDSKKEDFKKDIQELEEFILTKYEAIVSKIPDQKAAFETNSQKLKMDIVKK